MDELNLRLNENNEVVAVTTVEQETPISSTELQRQIDQHVAILADLESQLQAVEAFEVENNVEG
jgi:hypothetical protein